MKRKLLLFLLFIMPMLMMAKERTQSEALTIAKEYFSNYQQGVTRTYITPELVATSTDFNLDGTTRTYTIMPSFYIFNNGTTGFVIVSGDDRMKPILGYSDKGAFVVKDVPSNIKSFLNSYIQEMNELDEKKELSNVLIASTTQSYPTSVSPLLGDIMYNQSAPYNNLCPSGSVTGCVATAMAQVLRYYQYPTTGTGTFSYITETEKYSCSFNYGTTTFDWNNMLPQYITNEYNSTQANAVATLMYAAGVSVSMDYTSDESGAYSFDIPNALTSYFNYDQNIAYVLRTYFTYSEWMNMIKNELSSARPILYNGISSEGGHEFVFDGYDANDMVHVNWGWAGANDGYFVISELNPSLPGIGGGSNLGGGFTSSQGMVIGIQKPTNTSVYHSYFYSSGITLPSSNLQAGASFLPTINNLTNMSTTFTGELALILEDTEGNQTVLGNTYTLKNQETNEDIKSLPWSNVNSSLTFPTGLSDGAYLFYAATRNPSKNTSWDMVRGEMGSTSLYNCIVTNNQATFSPYWGTNIDVSASLTLAHDLYAGLTGDFTLTYQNNSTSRNYYGTISIGLINNNNQLIDLISSNDVFMTAGQGATTVNISEDIDSSITPGTYKIAPVAYWGTSYVLLSTPISTTINSYSGNSTLNIVSFGVTSSEIEENSNLGLVGVFTATGTAPVYCETITAVVATQGLVTQSSYSQNVFFNVGDTYNFSMSFNPNLTAGNYIVALFEDDSQLNNPINFTVKAATGIEDSNEVINDITIYTDQIGNTLFVKAPSDVNSIEIFSINGQLIRKDLLVGKGTEFSIPIDQLNTGTYIIMLRTNSKNYHEKFIKK